MLTKVYYLKRGSIIQIGTASQSIEIKAQSRIVQKRRTVEGESGIADAVEDATISVSDEWTKPEITS